MNNKKLLAVDLDGTLVSKGNKISKKNMKAMIEFIDQGNHIVFITGRPFYTSVKVADYFYKKTNRKIDYICCLKGSYIFDYINQKEIFKTTIDYSYFVEILNIAFLNKLAVTGYSNENVHKQIIEVYNTPKILYPLIKSVWVSKRFGKVNIHSIKQDLELNFFKLNLLKYSTKSNLLKAYNQIKKLHTDKFDISKTNNFMMEITPNNINKGFALKYISNLMQIPLHDSIAFGDSGNDVDMFKIANTSVITTKKKANKIKFNPTIILNKPVKSAISELINKHLLNK